MNSIRRSRSFMYMMNFFMCFHKVVHNGFGFAFGRISKHKVSSLQVSTPYPKPVFAVCCFSSVKFFRYILDQNPPSIQYRICL